MYIYIYIYMLKEFQVFYWISLLILFREVMFYMVNHGKQPCKNKRIPQ